jgi:hypothetical protein
MIEFSCAHIIGPVVLFVSVLFVMVISDKLFSFLCPLSSIRMQVYNQFSIMGNCIQIFTSEERAKMN